MSKQQALEEIRNEATVRGYVHKRKISSKGNTQALTILSKENCFNAYVPLKVNMAGVSHVEVTGRFEHKFDANTQKWYTSVFVDLTNPSHSVKKLEVRDRIIIIGKSENLLLADVKIIKKGRGDTPE